MVACITPAPSPAVLILVRWGLGLDLPEPMSPCVLVRQTPLLCHDLQGPGEDEGVHEGDGADGGEDARRGDLRLDEVTINIVQKTADAMADDSKLLLGSRRTSWSTPRSAANSASSRRGVAAASLRISDISSATGYLRSSASRRDSPALHGRWLLILRSKRAPGR